MKTVTLVCLCLVSAQAPQAATPWPSLAPAQGILEVIGGKERERGNGGSSRLLKIDEFRRIP
jgi:hypothetical protein